MSEIILDISLPQNVNIDLTVLTGAAAAGPNVTRLDDTTATAVTDDPIDVADYLGSPTWAQMVAAFGRGYNIPLPTSTTSYRPGDDADIEATIFTAAVRNAESIKVRNTLSDEGALNNNNSFGNTNRYTDESGTQVYTNDYFIDHYTGLGWYRVGITPDPYTWNQAIDDCLAFSTLGFSDFFLPSYQQILSLTDYTLQYVINNSSAPTSSLSRYIITSTTRASSTVNFLFFDQYLGYGSNTSKSAPGRTLLTYLYCRKHF